MKSFVIGQRTVRLRKSSTNLSEHEYRERQDSLSQLGFLCYRDYQRSATWKEIRLRVLERDGRKCRRCGEVAHQVHHSAYDIATLRGERLTSLFAICRSCHKHSHGSGEAREIVEMTEKQKRRRKKARAAAAKRAEVARSDSEKRKRKAEKQLDKLHRQAAADSKLANKIKRAKRRLGIM